MQGQPSVWRLEVLGDAWPLLLRLFWHQAEGWGRSSEWCPPPHTHTVDSEALFIPLPGARVLKASGLQPGDGAQVSTVFSGCLLRQMDGTACLLPPPVPLPRNFQS